MSAPGSEIELFESPADMQPAALPPNVVHDADAGTVRELMRVAIPLIVSSGSLSLMHVVDRILLTWVSVDALAAAMPAGMFHWTALGFPLGVAMYTNTFVAQYHGADRRDRLAAALWQGIWLALGFGAMLIVFAPFLSLVFQRLGHSAAVTKLEVEYFSVLCWGSAPMLLMATLSAFFSGRGQNSVVMWVDLVVSVLNGVLAYVLIFGKGPIPAMGIRGAALATVTANIAACVAFAVMIRRTNKREKYPFREQMRFDRELIHRMLRFGLPNGIQLLVDIGAYLLFVLVVGGLGTVELAATNLTFNLNSLAFIPMLGMGTAVLTIVGRRIGEGRPDLAAKSVWRALAVAEGYILIFIAIYIFLPDLLLRPYEAWSPPAMAPNPPANVEIYLPEVSTDDHAAFSDVKPVVIQLLYFVSAYCFFDAMAIVFGNAIRGAGDTRFSLIFTACTGWFLMVIPSMIASRTLEQPLWACWWATTLNITVLGTGLWLRFMGGKWRSMTVIEQSPSEEGLLSQVS
jgi:multidrug resistance protein, MATE family